MVRNIYLQVIRYFFGKFIQPLRSFTVKNSLIYTKEIKIGRCLIVLHWKERPEFKLTNVEIFDKAKIGFKEGNIPNTPHKEHKKIKELEDSIAGYFKERRPLNIDLQDLDFSGCSGFSKTILNALAGIPFGKITTYKRLAELSGFPGACRAVGSVMAKNPFPLLIPCHRVIRTNLSIGEYGPGADLKKFLICHETSESAVNAASAKRRKVGQHFEGLLNDMG